MTLNLDQDNIDYAEKSLTDSDSTYTTSDEQFYTVDTSSGTLTVQLSDSDTTSGHTKRFIDVGGNIETNAVTFSTQSSQKIDGSSGNVTWDQNNNSYVDLWSDGSDWFSSLQGAATAFGADERTINKVGGRGESNSTQSVASGATTTVEIDVVDTEDDAAVLDVDTTNNRIRVKKAGWISMFTGGIYTTNLGDGTRALFAIQINGTTIAQEETGLGANESFGATPTDVKDLSVDDDITLITVQTSGSSQSLTGDETTSIAAIHEG